jgi:type I restriction enzyme S subunit
MSQLEITTLGKSCEFFNGKAHEKDIDVNGKYIVVNSKFISQEGRVVKRTKEQIFPLYKGDIVMVMSDVPNGKALAKCFIIDKDESYSLNQRICCIRSKEFDTKYLYYQLNRNEHFLAFNNGENQTNLRKDDILDCPLIKPSMEEQKRMVAELDLAFTELEKAKANTRNNLRNSTELFKSELNGTFIRKGENWSERKLKEIGLTQTGNTPKTSEPDNYGDFIPFVKPPHFLPDGTIETGESYLSEKGLKSARLFKENSILMVCIGATIGKTGFSERIVTSNQQINALTPKSEFEARFFYYALTTDIFFNKIMQASSQATLPIINKSKWENLTVPFPNDKKEQIEIVKRLDTLSVEAIKLQEKYETKLEKLEELKSGILKRAFENELIEAE